MCESEQKDEDWDGTRGNCKRRNREGRETRMRASRLKGGGREDKEKWGSFKRKVGLRLESQTEIGMCRRRHIHQISFWRWPPSCHKVLWFSVLKHTLSERVCVFVCVFTPNLKHCFEPLHLLCLVSGLSPECGVEHFRGEQGPRGVGGVSSGIPANWLLFFVLWYCIDPWRRNTASVCPPSPTPPLGGQGQEREQQQPVKDSLTCSRTLQQAGCLFKVPSARVLCQRADIEHQTG